MTDEFIVRPMDRGDMDVAVEWARQEGWNPGKHDADCFATVDPHGFIGGFLDGRMVAAISNVNYDDGFSFLGFYIVDKPYRGRGYGIRVWREAIEHANGRLIGLDGVVAEQENYRRSGFELAYRNIRFGGRPIMGDGPGPDAGGFEIRPVSGLTDEVEQYDRLCFPAPRANFLSCWIFAPGHVARAIYRGGRLAGYGVIRPCGTGRKIGPLFADDRAAAETLLAALLGSGAELREEIFLDVAETNGEAVALASAMGLEPVFETARMYNGAPPRIELNKMFGVTTFELG